MTDVEAAFEAHDAFEREDGDRYAARTSTFPATVQIGGRQCRLTCELPTLGAVVAGEEVADVVEEGWFDTLRRRLDEISGVVTTDDPVSFTTTRDGEQVLVETTFESPAPADDALALVNFVEGTWLQGIVPGYEYVDRIQALREHARDRGASSS